MIDFSGLLWSSFLIIFKYCLLLSLGISFVYPLPFSLLKIYKHIQDIQHARGEVQEQEEILLSWTWIENTHVRGSRCQNNTLLYELEAWQERSYRLLIQGRSKVRSVSWLQFPGPGVALFLGMAPRSCLHKFGGSQGGTDGGHVKAQAECVGSVTGSVRSGCCIPPISSTATSRLFPLFPKSWFI